MRLLLIFSFFLTLGAWAGAPVADGVKPLKVDGKKPLVVELPYTDSDNDLATECIVSGATNIQEIEPCNCKEGKCSVTVIGSRPGKASFDYQIIANDEKSETSTVSILVGSSINVWLDLIGMKGLLLIIGAGIFLYSYVNSIKLFSWIDNQTYGTRDYILKKFEVMFIEVDPQRITWVLLFMSFGLGCLTFGLIAFLGKIYLAILLGIVMTIVGWKSPKPIVDFFENRRKRKYQLQMVDALNLMANGLRAGLTVPQSIGMVVDELPAPVSQEFNLVLQQAKIGVPLDEALENLKKRVYTEDNEMFVTSVNILRETGGNLAETFDTIVLVIRERVRLQLKIETYIASGKIQAYIIGAMPFLMILMFGLGDPDYFPLLFGTILGIIALIVIVGMVSFGMWVIFKIIDIKV